MESSSVCSKRKRRNKWTPEAEKVLFVVWSRNLSGLRASRLNYPVFIKMSHEMDALGYPYSVTEIKTKIHNLTSKYRDERKLMEETGTNTTWALYPTIDKIYGKGESFISDNEESADENSCDRNISVKSEGIEVDYSSENSDEDSMDEAVLTCFDTMNKNMLSLIQHTNEQNIRSIALQKEMLEIQKERNEILKKMLDIFKTKWKKTSSAEDSGPQKKIKLTEVNGAGGCVDAGVDKSGIVNISQSKEEDKSGIANISQLKEEDKSGIANISQLKDEDKSGIVNISQSKEEDKGGIANISQSKEEDKSGIVNISRSKEEDKSGIVSIIQSKEEDKSEIVNISQKKEEVVPAGISVMDNACAVAVNTESSKI